MEHTRRRAGALVVAAVAVLVWMQSGSAFAQERLDERCIVSVLNRNVRVKPDGSWVLPNIPANFGRVRARATCVSDGQTTSGESEPFTVLANGSANVPPILLGATTPVPVSMAISPTSARLEQIGAAVQLAVVASYSDLTSSDVSAAAEGTTYRVSNPAIASIGAEGLVTAVSSGTVLVQAINEGTATLAEVQVVLSADSDGDGIPDDIELQFGLDPNNAADGFADADRDGLNNRDEVARGTGVHVADSDGDGLADGEEVRAGADGFITNPLLADTDNDGVRDALEVASGSDPTNATSLNLAQALESLSVAPPSFAITVNSVLGVGSQQLAVTGQLRDGGTISLTSTARGTNYTSSNLDACNFGAPDGRVFGSANGSCTITVTNAGFTATATGTVTNFQPTALGSIAIPGYANNVDVNGGTAYVAAGASGLVVVNVVNPAAPVIIATLDTPGNANDVRVVGDRAYVADGSAGLRIIDVTNPAAPVALGFLDTPGEANDVIASSTFAYVADGASGVHIIDVSQPASPQLVRTIDTPGTARGVDVEGTTLVVADDTPSIGLRVIDIATPATAALVGSIVLGGAAIDVDLANGIAYIAAYTGGVHIVDVRTPATPSALANIPGSAPNGFVPRDVQVAGRFALFAEQLFANAVAPIVDIGDPAQPAFRGVLDFGQDYAGTGVAVSGPHVYWTGQSFVVSTENGSTGTTRLFIGQYIAIEDLAGQAPTIALTQPPSGSTAIEGAQITVRADAVDDIAVASVTFIVNGATVFIDTSEPFEARLTVPPATSPMVIGARAADYGGNSSSAAPVTVNVIPDPLTLVVGRVVDPIGVPVSGATVELLTLGLISNSLGVFSFEDVPTVQGPLRVRASVEIDNRDLRGLSAAVPPVLGGTTDVGDIQVSEQRDVNIVPVSLRGVGNAFPFGENASPSPGFMGFIYRNVPEFSVRPGDRFAFDLGRQNNVDTRRNIYFAVANANPVAGGNPQGIRALAWTRMTSDSQIPLNPRGDSVQGNFELTYTAEASFDFPGGGFIVAFGGSPPGAYLDLGFDQVLSYTNYADPSGYFHRRFYQALDQTLGVLDGGGPTLSDNDYLGGIRINPPQQP